MSKKAFLEEAKIMKQFRDKNILVFYAVDMSQDPLIILTEYMNKGSLQKLLKEEPKLSIPNFVYISIQVRLPFLIF